MQFPYLPGSGGPFGPILMPLLPIRLANGGIAIDEIGLVDTGSTVNLLPYDLGVRLGFNWRSAGPALPLGGNVGRHAAKGVVVVGSVGHYPPVSLAFAWTRSPDARLLLGEVNFLDEFDVCFFRSRGVFELQPRP